MDEPILNKGQVVFGQIVIPADEPVCVGLPTSHNFEEDEDEDEEIDP